MKGFARTTFALCLSALSACVVQSPLPAQTLPRPLPALPAQGPGQGVLLLDVTDGPTEARAASGQTCTTPCALALPLGAQPLTLKYRDVYGLEAENFTTAVVSREPRMLRRTLERVHILKPGRRKLAQSLLYMSSLAALAALATLPFSGERADTVGKWLYVGAAASLVMVFPLSIGVARRVSGSELQVLLPRSERLP